MPTDTHHAHAHQAPSPGLAPWYGLPLGTTACAVRPLVHSSLALIESETLRGGSDESTRRPSFVFLIQHPSGDNILWDLGIAPADAYGSRHGQGQHDSSTEAPSMSGSGSKHARYAPHVAMPLADAVRQAGVEPGDINKVIISHKHWDHTGDPSAFPNAQIYVGAADRDGVEVLRPAHVASRVVSVDWEQEQEQEHENENGANSSSTRIAAFEHSLDLYKDGSVLILDTRGHTPGHLCLLVRTNAPTPAPAPDARAPDNIASTSGAYLLLGSDCCHHVSLISPLPAHAGRTFGSGPGAHDTLYEDIPRAGDTLRRIRRCEGREEVMVGIAHDEGLWARWFPRARVRDGGLDTELGGVAGMKSTEGDAGAVDADAGETTAGVSVSVSEQNGGGRGGVQTASGSDYGYGVGPDLKGWKDKGWKVLPP